MIKNNHTYILILLAIFFVSCQENSIEEIPVIETQNPFLGLEEMKASEITSIQSGQYHNIILETFLNDSKGYEFSTFDQLTRDIQNSYLKTNKSRVLFKLEVDYQRIESSIPIGDPGIASRDNPNSYYSWLQDSYNGLVSDEFQNLFDDIIMNDARYDQAMTKTTELISSNLLSETETEALYLFLAVAKASNDFWTSYDDSSSESNRSSCDPASQRYLADAVGFLFWGGLGAVGYSWGAYEIQESQYHGGCIR